MLTLAGMQIPTWSQNSEITPLKRNLTPPCCGPIPTKPSFGTNPFSLCRLSVDLEQAAHFHASSCAFLGSLPWTSTKNGYNKYEWGSQPKIVDIAIMVGTQKLTFHSWTGGMIYHDSEREREPAMQSIFVEAPPYLDGRGFPLVQVHIATLRWTCCHIM